MAKTCFSLTISFGAKNSILFKLAATIKKKRVIAYNIYNSYLYCHIIGSIHDELSGRFVAVCGDFTARVV